MAKIDPMTQLRLGSYHKFARGNLVPRGSKYMFISGSLAPA